MLLHTSLSHRYVTDGTVAILISTLFFLIPSQIPLRFCGTKQEEHEGTGEGGKNLLQVFCLFVVSSSIIFKGVLRSTPERSDLKLRVFHFCLYFFFCQEITLCS